MNKTWSFVQRPENLLEEIRCIGCRLLQGVEWRPRTESTRLGSKRPHVYWSLTTDFLCDGGAEPFDSVWWQTLTPVFCNYANHRNDTSWDHDSLGTVLSLKANPQGWELILGQIKLRYQDPVYFYTCIEPLCYSDCLPRVTQCSSRLQRGK